MGYVVANILINLLAGDRITYLLLYVDDIILTISSSLREKLISELKTKFPMSNLGSLNYFLRIGIILTPSYLLLTQKKYAQKFLECASMGNCKPTATPMDTKFKLSADSGPPVRDPTSYHSLAHLILLTLILLMRSSRCIFSCIIKNTSRCIKPYSTLCSRHHWSRVTPISFSSTLDHYSHEIGVVVQTPAVRLHDIVVYLGIM